MAMGIITKDEVIDIVNALASASAEATNAIALGPHTPDFLRGYHAALYAVALALGRPPSVAAGLLVPGQVGR